MAQMLIIAMAIGIFLHDVQPPTRILTGPMLALVVLGPMLLLSILIAWACRRTAANLNAESMRRGDRVISFCRFMFLPWFAAMLYAGVLVWIRRAIGDLILIDELVMMLPVFVVMAWAWWCYYPIDRRLREAALFGRIDRGEAVYPIWTRGQFMLAQLRIQVLLVLVPLGLILAWAEAVQYLPVTSETSASIVVFAGAMGIFLLSPVLIRFIFDTEPLPPGEVRDRMEHLCRVHGVKVRQLLLWRTFGGIINAAVMGVVAPVRYIMITDALLDSFPREQVEAVMAHELAHVRKHHMFWLLGFAFVVSLAIDAILALLFGPEVRVSWLPAMVVAVLAAKWVVAFGWASRRIERQADAFAAAHLAREKQLAVIDADSAATMIHALQRVADLNHIRVAQRSWRHGSIESRQHALRRLVGQPLRHHAADRAVRRVQFVTVLLAVGLTIYHLTTHATG